MAGEPKKRRISPRQITSLVLAALVLVFGFANSTRVKVDFLVFDRSARLIFVILGSAVLGALAGGLFHWRRDRD